MDRDSLNLLTKVNLVMALALTHMKPPRTTRTLATTAWLSGPSSYPATSTETLATIITFPRADPEWQQLLMTVMDSLRHKSKTPEELKHLVRWLEVMPAVDLTASLEADSTKLN